jgi:hypothetical protein
MSAPRLLPRLPLRLHHYAFVVRDQREVEYPAITK